MILFFVVFNVGYSDDDDDIVLEVIEVELRVVVCWMGVKNIVLGFDGLYGKVWVLVLEVFGF